MKYSSHSQSAFTLVELLVVMSIISMLASIVIASTATVQAKGRDAKRTQQIHQIELATKLYTDTKGHAPLATTGCGVQSTTPTSYEQVSACFVVSSDTAKWSALAAELSDYIKLPADPCPSCTSDSGQPTGYTYIAPLAMQYFCAQSGNCTADDSTYQTYAALERQSAFVGGSSGGAGTTYFVSPSSDTTAPSVPTNVQITAGPWSGGSYPVLLTWDASVDSGSGIDGYLISPLEDNYVPVDPVPGTTRETSASAFNVGNSICYAVRAYDIAGNQSALSSQVCTGAVPAPMSTPGNVSVVSVGGGMARVSWTASMAPADAENARYRVLRKQGNGWIPSETTDIQFVGPGISGQCWKVGAIADLYGNPEVYFSLLSDQVCLP